MPTYECGSERIKRLRSIRCHIFFLFLLLYGPILLGIVAAQIDYTETCSFLDGSHPCTFGQQVTREIAFIDMITWFLFPIAFTLLGKAIGEYWNVATQVINFHRFLPCCCSLSGALLGVCIGMSYRDLAGWFVIEVLKL